MLGAPLGGTTRGGQYGFEFLASMLITPPNFGGGVGTYLPSTVVVAVGEPGVPVICWAGAEGAAAMMAATNIAYARMYWFGFMFPPLFHVLHCCANFLVPAVGS